MATPRYPDEPPPFGGPYGPQYPAPYGVSQPSPMYPYQGYGYPPPPPPPPPPPKRNALALVAALVGGVAVLGAAGWGIQAVTSRVGSDTQASTTLTTQTAPTAPSATASPAADQCSAVTAEMLTLQPQSADEPVVRLPLPRGWDRVTKADSDIVRAMLRASSLASGGAAPTAVVAIAKTPGNIAAGAVFDRQLAELKRGLNATVISQTPTKVCGLPARDIRYTASIHGGPEHPLRVLVVADQDKPTYVVTLTVQSLEPDNPTYLKDAETLLQGLQVLPAGSR